jgi:pimeloyl-ACP methyl ester carboxylesterase
MGTVTSHDGTTIAYDRTGSGPTVVLVDGALGYRANNPLAEQLITLLARDFTVYTYDRRGRGDSGDTPPYAVEREVEDIEALAAAGGGQALVYGLSSGGVLALRAAERVPGITRLAVYEPPFILDDSRPPLPPDYVHQVTTLSASGRRGDAVALFMTAAAGVPEEFVGGMRQMPMWPDMEAVAHTLAYDGTVMGDLMSGKPLPPGSFAGVTIPTLVLAGGNSEPFMHTGADALAAALPDAHRRTLQDQDHAVDGAVLAPVLTEFFRR